MSWCDEDGMKVDDPSGAFLPFKDKRKLHRSLVRYLYNMGWTQLEIGKFFNRTDAWACQVLAETEKQLPERIPVAR